MSDVIQMGDERGRENGGGDRRRGGGGQGGRRGGDHRSGGRGGRRYKQRGRGRGRRRDGGGHEPHGKRDVDFRNRLGTKREIVLPGDMLSKDGPKGGDGTYSDGGAIFASQLGIKAQYNDRVSVIPLAGRYVPFVGDEVIGKIVDIGSASWMVDINSPYIGPLHADETPWDIGYGEAGRYLGLGDLVIARVSSVDVLNRIRLSMDGWGLKKLNGGHVVMVSHSKIPRIIGKGGSMIKLLKDGTGCLIQVGQNGRIWLGGEPEMIMVAVEAIRIIEKNAHTVGLTQNIGTFLGERLRSDSGHDGHKRDEASGQDDEIEIGKNGED